MIYRCFALLCLLIGLSSCRSNAEIEHAVLRSADGRVAIPLELEIADTEAKRQLGLMYRREMSSNHGMLFVFADEESRSFWMKNTFLELDMAFLDSSLKVVSVIRRATPLTESPRESGKPAQYVLEVLGGSLEKWGIGEGARLERTAKGR